MNIETATLAGGCFWCLEAVYDEFMGVEAVESGYMGGHTVNPTYGEVCDGDTGHAEVVQIRFDSDVVSFKELLEVFFTVHDPTTLNRQGNDIGTQYRSAIFYHSPEQEAVAEATITAINAGKIWGKPLVTKVVPASTFHIAEADHQEYFARTGNANPYCSVVVAPKVAKFRKNFLAKLKR
jgi:peptide-methionine (S)-S-oxide reductase